MLSNKDKLLYQQWEERRYRNHRMKIKNALPVIDDKAPKNRSHVKNKLKKFQMEKERQIKIQKDNFHLLQNLTKIMSAKRLDNNWHKPLPNFNNKVGIYIPKQKLKEKFEKLYSSESESYSNKNIKCVACELKKQNKDDFQEIFYPSIFIEKLNLNE